MDIEIIIKGGEELSEFYPRNYERFNEKINDLITEMFPGVNGWIVSSVLTDRHQAEKDNRERLREEEFKQTLIRIFEEPGFKEEFWAKVATSET